MRKQLRVLSIGKEEWGNVRSPFWNEPITSKHSEALCSVADLSFWDWQT